MKLHKLALMGVLLLASGCSLLPQEAEPLPLEVGAPVTTKREVITAKLSSIEVSISVGVAFGTERQQSLYTKASGRVNQVKVEAGQHVAAGDLLLELETGGLKYDLTRADLSLKRRQLALEALQGKIGFADAPSAADLAGSQLDVQEAEVNLAQARENLAGSQIVAPFAGTITSVSVISGDQAEAYKVLMVLSGDGDIVARATVDQSNSAQLQAGQPVRLFPADGDPTAVPGSIVAAPQIGATGVGTVLIRMDRQSTRTKMGQAGRAEIVVQRKDSALVIPKSAVKTFSGRQFVTLVRGESRQEVSIKTGLESDTQIEVLEGLKVGDQVIGR